MNNRYTQGVCEDGAAILFEGKQLTVDQIVERLNVLHDGHDAMCKSSREMLDLVRDKLGIDNEKETS